jgi:hypothetical protein
MPLICAVYIQCGSSIRIKHIPQQEPVFCNNTFQQSEYTGISPVTKYLGFCLQYQGSEEAEKHFRGTNVDVGFCMCESYNVI